MPKIVTLKLTQAEMDLLDWLAHKLDAPSRSDALRRALSHTANTAGVQPTALLDVRDEREQHKPRRSTRNMRRAHALEDRLGA